MPKQADIFEYIHTNNYVAVEQLLESGVSANTSDQFNQFTVLELATLQNKIAIVRLLLEHGADVNKGYYPPIKSALVSVEMLQLFIEYGAQVNVPNLITAALFQRKPELIIILIKAGLNLELKNTAGLTPLALARSLQATAHPSDMDSGAYIIDILSKAQQASDQNKSNFELINNKLRHDVTSFFSGVPQDITRDFLGPMLRNSHKFIDYEDPASIKKHDMSY